MATFGEADLSSDFGSDWAPSDDSLRGGDSTVELNTTQRSDGDDWALHIQGTLSADYPFPWAGAMVFTGQPPMQAVDLSVHRSISFEVRGDHDHLNLLVFSGSAAIPASKILKISSEWQRLEVSFEDLGAEAASLKAFLFSAGPERGSFELWIDNVLLQ